MGTYKQAGFTIIEVTLFLAISGILIVALIGSAGFSINVQRYRDSAETFKSVLQQQYADLNSVQNSRDSSWSCSGNASSTKNGPVHEAVGQSDCVLVGKYVRLEGTNINIYNVLAHQISTNSQPDDITTLHNNYALNVTEVESEATTLEWGAAIAWENSATPPPSSPRTLGLLIVRSPESGQIYTFTSNDVPDMSNLNAGTVNPAFFTGMIVAGDVVPGQGAQTICIDSGGPINNDRSVYVNSYASSSTSIELRTNDYVDPVTKVSPKC